MMNVIVTGGRGYQDYQRVYAVLDKLYAKYGSFLKVIEGGCPTGADLFARTWSYHRKVMCRTYPADWHTHGKAAGPIRNAKMCRENIDALVVAFPGGHGTQNCIQNALQLGMSVVQF